MCHLRLQKRKRGLDFLGGGGRLEESEQEKYVNQGLVDIKVKLMPSPSPVKILPGMEEGDIFINENFLYNRTIVPCFKSFSLRL